jgi:hypothetical protein
MKLWVSEWFLETNSFSSHLLLLPQATDILPFLLLHIHLSPTPRLPCPIQVFFSWGEVLWVLSLGPCTFQGKYSTELHSQSSFSGGWGGEGFSMYFYLFIYLFIFIWGGGETGFLCRPGWPRTQKSACSASQVLGLKACATSFLFVCFFFFAFETRSHYVAQCAFGHTSQ